MLGKACNSELVSDKLTSSCDQLSAQANESGNLDNVVSRIAPDESLIQRRLMSENTRNKTSRLYQGLASLRTSSGPASVSFNNQVLTSGGGAGDGFSSPWTLLTSVQSEHFERNETSKEAGYESSNLGALVGLGYRINNDLNLGIALDWSSYEVDFASKGGNLDSDITSLTGFLSYYKGQFSVNVQAGYTSGDTQAKRVFEFPTRSVAASDYGSNQWNVSTQLDWAWHPGAWGVSPFLRVDYLNTEIDAFVETGDSIWNSSTDKQTHKLLNSSLGLDTTYTITKSWGVIIPGVKLSAINQSNLSNDPVNFQLVDASSLGNFQLRADSADSMFYEWTLGTAIVLPNGVSTFVSARSVTGLSESSARQITAGINWEF
ncbi:MAG: autotransporter outer membrane beta-barrel domain-containing protein [Gammaproteobacteria bacterium]|nr:MAG: autotransporter outer membrane beta-barrel domain-containing protein [Gammaproteobacteria bacterium]